MLSRSIIMTCRSCRPIDALQRESELRPTGKDTSLEKTEQKSACDQPFDILHESLSDCCDPYLSLVNMLSIPDL